MATSDSNNAAKSVLFVDIGNSRIKAAISNKNQWTNAFSGSRFKLPDFLSYVNNNDRIRQMVVSSVVKSINIEIKKLKELNIRFLTVADILPGKLDYKTPETLGIDRYLACLGAWSRSQEKNVVVIDAGTACTIDFMDADGIYRGGIITPGLGLLEKALHEFAPALPQASRELPEEWPGKTTTECIRWGITGSFANSLHAFIQHYRDTYGEFEVWLTGGDSDDLRRLLQVQFHYNAYLVFDGMKAFSQTNKTI